MLISIVDDYERIIINQESSLGLDSKIEALAAHPVFQAILTDPRILKKSRQIDFSETLEQFAAKCKICRFETGQVVLEEGEINDSLYFVINGSVALMKFLPAISSSKYSSKKLPKATRSNFKSKSKLFKTTATALTKFLETTSATESLASVAASSKRRLSLINFQPVVEIKDRGDRPSIHGDIFIGVTLSSTIDEEVEDQSEPSLFISTSSSKSGEIIDESPFAVNRTSSTKDTSAESIINTLSSSLPALAAVKRCSSGSLPPSRRSSDITSKIGVPLLLPYEGSTQVEGKEDQAPLQRVSLKQNAIEQVQHNRLQSLMDRNQGSEPAMYKAPCFIPASTTALTEGDILKVMDLSNGGIFPELLPPIVAKLHGYIDNDLEYEVGARTADIMNERKSKVS